MRYRNVDFHKEILKKKKKLFISMGLILIGTIFGPKILSDYGENRLLNKIVVETIEEKKGAYRYKLNIKEKVFILSRCLNNQIYPQSEHNPHMATGKITTAQDSGESYAFILNTNGPTEEEITEEEVYKICNDEIKVLKKLEILPEEIREVTKELYQANLYSAIDMIEPRNHVSVWKLSLEESLKNSNKENKVIDIYLDAENGKVYEFYVRGNFRWEEIDAHEVIHRWGEYMGFEEMEDYKIENPLLEKTPYIEKFMISGIGSKNTVVSVGFFEGINEFFIKISK